MSDPKFKAEKNPKVTIALLLAIILIWLAFQYRSNGFFSFEDVSLGMTNEQVLFALPGDAGKFKKIKLIDQKTGKTHVFEMLELRDKLSPWTRFLVGSMADEVVSISAWSSDLTPGQVDEIRGHATSQYGIPDDILKSKYGAETLVWGDAVFNKKDLMQPLKRVNGRAIIYRFRKPGSIYIYVTRDGKGPNFFF